MNPQSERDPAIVLPYLIGRKLTAEELYAAFGVKRSTYYDQLEKGTLLTADKLISAARHLGINPVTLLRTYGLLTSHEVMEDAPDAIRTKVAEDVLGESNLTTERRRLASTQTTKATVLARLLRTSGYGIQPEMPPL